MIAIGDSLALVSRTVSGLPVDTVAESYSGLRRDERLSPNNPNEDLIKKASARHRNRGNIVFCDGHVEAVTFRRLFLERDDASLRRWNRDNEPHR
jgi:prepilin-type processing-associated H-X9-DG protein